MSKVNCLLVGAGYMTQEYLKVLKSKQIDTIVVGRGIKNVNNIVEKFHIESYSGGIEKFVFNDNYTHAIVAVSIDDLFSTTCILIKKGVKKILVEKPACLELNELEIILKLCNEYNSEIFIAYNRRFYSSIETLKKKIISEEGIQLINFEFTEWAHLIDQKKFSKAVLNKFFIANSTHVVDTVFHLIGRPSLLNSLIFGNSISWHPSGSIFLGSGVSIKNIPFTYSSNWGSAGRWSIEVFTNQNRYYLKPMEKLFVQKRGTLDLTPVEINDQIDVEFKAGLYLMVEDFFNITSKTLCKINEQYENFSFYEKIAGY
jgi:predicted dehydrogenase